MTTPQVGLNLNIVSNCTECCPRMLRIMCCCCGADNKVQATDEKVQSVAKPIYEEHSPRVIHHENSVEFIPTIGFEMMQKELDCPRVEEIDDK